ncbi:MAG: hypothetical protein NUV85_00950 [Candidatus Berkelbacteria bacterium]|nr:hypothetical protein [Candidatus Berkelbacteria bacterium]
MSSDASTLAVTDLVGRIRSMFGIGEANVDQAEDLRYVLYARKSTDDSGKQERSIEN